MNKSIFKFSNILMFILYAFVFLCIFGFLTHYTMHSALCIEDTNYIRHQFSFNRIWSFVGLYITRLLLFEIPKLLNVHVYSTLWIWRSFEYIVLIGLIFLYSRFLNTRILRFFGFLFAAVITMYVTIYNIEFIQSSYVFNRYIVSLVCFFVFHWFYLKNMLEFEGQNRKYNIIGAVMLLILSTSTEIFIIETVVMLIIVSLVNYMTKKIKFSKDLFWGLIATAAINLIGNKVFDEKNAAIPKDLDIEYFFRNLYSYCIYKASDILIFLAIIMVIALVIFIKNKNDYKMPLYAVSMLIANFTAAVLLIFFDWRFLFNDKIMIVFYLNYTIPLFVLISYIYKHINRKKLFTGFVVVCMIGFMAHYITVRYQRTYAHYLHMMNVNNIKRTLVYQYEKAARYAQLTGRKPVFLYDKFLYCETNDFMIQDIHNAMKYLDVKMYNPNTVICFDTNNPDISVFNSMRVSYKHVYDSGFCLTKNKSKMITNVSEGEKIKEDLAIVTNEELKKTDFSKLKDDKFVLDKTF